MFKIGLYLLTIFFLSSCVKGGGSASNNTNPPPTSGTSLLANIVPSQPSLFLGLNNISTTKSGTFTLTNNGNGPSKNIVVSGAGSSNINLSENCSGKTLQIGESCSVSINFNASTSGSHKKSITISENGKSIVVPVYGYTYNFSELDWMIDTILQKQETSSTSVSLQGSWNYNSNVSHLSSQAIIIDALIKSKQYYSGTLSFSSLLTSNINYQSVPNSSWKPLDLSLYFMAFNSKGTLGYNDDDLIKFNPLDVSSDFDSSFSKWNNSEYQKPKNISASVLTIVNENYKTIYGTDIPNWSSIFSKQLESRKLITTDGSNNVISSTTDITSQLSYLLDPDRLSENGYLENPLKDIYLFFEYFKKTSDTSNLNKMAYFYLNHWEHDVEDLQLSPLNLNLKYNPIEFNYTSFKKPSKLLTTLITDKLWWSIDYSNSASGCYNNSDDFQSLFTTQSTCVSNGFVWKKGFSNTLSCRDISYALLNLVNSYNDGNLASSDKQKASLFVQDGILELKNSLGCGYDNSTKTFLSQDNGNFTYNENNGIALINKIYHRLPDSIVSVDEKMKSYDQLIQELGPGGSLAFDDPSVNPLYLSEALRQLIELKEK